MAQGSPCQALPEHTGTTDDTHILGTDAVDKRGYIVGVLITRVVAGTITIYDTNVATGAPAFGSERVNIGPIVLQTADIPFFINLSGLPVPFRRGIGVDLSASGLGVQIFWRS